jgi:hypothetical protein
MAVQLEGRMLSKVEEILPFNERRAEDSVAGRKNPEPCGRNSVFLREED